MGSLGKAMQAWPLQSGQSKMVRSLEFVAWRHAIWEIH